MSEELTKVNEALKSENEGLKLLIEQLQAEKLALDQTAIEVLRANITLKSGLNLTEARMAKLTHEAEEKNKKIAESSLENAKTE